MASSGGHHVITSAAAHKQLIRSLREWHGTPEHCKAYGYSMIVHVRHCFPEARDDEYERMRTFSAGAVDALLGVATAVDQYVIEADASAVDQFHAHLAITIRRLESAKADPASAAMERVRRMSMRLFVITAIAPRHTSRRRWKDLTAASEGLAQLA